MNVFISSLLSVFILYLLCLSTDGAPSVFDIFPRRSEYKTRAGSDESDQGDQQKIKRCICENNLCFIDKLLRCRHSIIPGKDSINKSL